MFERKPDPTFHAATRSPSAGVAEDAHVVDDGNTDPFGRFIRVGEVAKSIGLSRAMIYRLMQDRCDPFPRPVKVGQASLWVEREVVAWKARRVARRG